MELIISNAVLRSRISHLLIKFANISLVQELINGLLPSDTREGAGGGDQSAELPSPISISDRKYTSVFALAISNLKLAQEN